jgi:hypothetical protein
MRDPFEGVIQPGQSGWYWHEGRVIEVVRHADGTLWVFWRVEGKDPRLDFPTGPRCVEPEEDQARRALNTQFQGLLQQSERDKNIAALQIERLQGALDAEKAYYACLQGEFNRAVALAQEHCPKPELGQSWLMAGIPLLAQRAAALEVEVERLKGQLNLQECDTIFWRERAEKAAARERAAIVAWLRSGTRLSPTRYALIYATSIEAGQHWPTEGGTPS